MSGHSMSTARHDSCPPGVCLYQSVGESCVPTTDRDPSTEQWREAVTGSTGARLRRALEANDELARDLATAIEHNAALSRQLVDVTDAAARNVARLTYARAQLGAANQRVTAAHGEIEQLRAQIAQWKPGIYHLTEKGLAALTLPETTQEQPHG